MTYNFEPWNFLEYSAYVFTLRARIKAFSQTQAKQLGMTQCPLQNSNRQTNLYYPSCGHFLSQSSLEKLEDL
jgi:hypothetical protein